MCVKLKSNLSVALSNIRSLVFCFKGYWQRWYLDALQLYLLGVLQFPFIASSLSITFCSFWGKVLKVAPRFLLLFSEWSVALSSLLKRFFLWLRFPFYLCHRSFDSICKCGVWFPCSAVFQSAHILFVQEFYIKCGNRLLFLWFCSQYCDGYSEHPASLCKFRQFDDILSTTWVGMHLCCTGFSMVIWEKCHLDNKDMGYTRSYLHISFTDMFFYSVVILGFMNGNIGQKIHKYKKG